MLHSTYFYWSLHGCHIEYCLCEYFEVVLHILCICVCVCLRSRERGITDPIAEVWSGLRTTCPTTCPEEHRIRPSSRPDTASNKALWWDRTCTQSGSSSGTSGVIIFGWIEITQVSQWGQRSGQVENVCKTWPREGGLVTFELRQVINSLNTDSTWKCQEVELAKVHDRYISKKKPGSCLTENPK